MQREISGPDLVRQHTAGDLQAAEDLYRRFAQRLWHLAEQKIDQRLRRRVEPDDIVQSVFRTFFRRTQKGEYAFDHSGALWRMLVCVTLNKIRKRARREHQGKRDIDAEVYLDLKGFPVDELAGAPRPEDAAILLDELEVLLAGCDPTEHEIVRLRLEGFTPSEIARQIGVARWTIRRFLDRIGAKLQRQLGVNPPNDLSIEKTHRGS
ncbi:MAG: sigma-70 family RNA polymerase sigma factor [Planctomycetia bacterium]|nr:sigma-70 family RNA polymerase sigma factor [Planctomycetia bacterium]